MKFTVVLAFFLTVVLIWTCQTAQTVHQPAEKELMKTGAEITKSVGSELVKTVQQQMAEGGVDQALEFCRIQALPITDSLAKQFNVSIKRTSMRTRNPKNSPNNSELDVLSKMQGQKIFEPAISYSENQNPVYYEPIVLKDFCQTCHGFPGNSMTVETDSMIKAHYPDDRATGFSTGDLRGMWVVTFDGDPSGMQ